ncbi:uncharacterized protein At4g04775-like [Brassica napus]|uniref:uncharacterized protein At4g04775-like n=1 Tax=Brassica napus TaxID=3708 RepID=UPI002078DCB4|nr:uncharacterized protein At4g04775-like [Brassica napus]
MTSQRRSFDGIPSRCWCGKGIVTYVSKTDENPYRRFYRCKLGLQRKKEDHLFKWVDEAMFDELRRIDAQQEITEEEIGDLKKCLKKADERVDVGCIGIIQWLFERVCN